MIVANTLPLQGISKILNKQKGFTLVEVMIVLGIGAAIIALALIVVPTVLRNQRDTQRQSAVSTIFSSVNNFSSRRNGNLPTNVSGSNKSTKIFNRGKYS